MATNNTTNGKKKRKRQRNNKDTKSKKQRRQDVIQDEEMKEIIQQAQKLEKEEKERVPEAVSEYFHDLPISEATRQGVKDMGFEKMYPVQHKAIPPALKGFNVLGSAKTGSGKTLAFLIPVIERIYDARWDTKESGVAAIVVAPVRELAIQIFSDLKELLTHHETISATLIIGGTNYNEEIKKLQRGTSIIIATPGRLVDHMKNTDGWTFSNLQCLVFDEVDRILDNGFEKDLYLIIKFTPKERQTLLFSATQTEEVKNLARLAIDKPPLEIHVDVDKDDATAENLEQGYVVVDSDKRFLLLFTFISKFKKKKVIVFVSSVKAVQFYSDLLNYVNVPVIALHGKKKQKQRTNIFVQFCNAKSGVLICTDVAARGLHIPEVDWIVQFDPPDDTKDYIHRVGRTARAGREGKAILFLLPSELEFLDCLKENKVPVKKYEFPQKKLAKVQAQLLKIISKNYFLHMQAIDAYKSYLISYSAHSLTSIFDPYKLDLKKVSQSFGLEVPPKVDLNLRANGKTPRSKRWKN